MIVIAPAKINLALNVISKREDGYHNIDIVSLPLELHDSIEIEAYPKKYGTFVTCDDASLLCDESNLVYVAYRLMKNTFKFDSGMRIRIYKRIPMEAGLAGGSADAGAVINGLIKMKKLSVDEQTKINLGIHIGSDVPYCIFNKPTRLRGMGEQLEFLKVKKNWSVLLIQPDEGLSTKGVYQLADTMEMEHPDIDALVKALEENDDEAIATNMKNSLQNAAIAAVPEIQNIIDRLHSYGLNKVMMSGSGSSVFALADDHKKIEEIAKEFDDDTHSVWVTKTACPL